MLAGLACVVSTGCVIAGEAELPDLEVVNSGIAIPAAPPEADGSEVTLSVSFRQKPNRAGLASNNFRDVRVNAVNLEATAGISDLSFVRSLRILANNPSAATNERKAPVEIARYERAAGHNVGRSIEIANTPPADVTALWKGDEVNFTLEVSGQMPTLPWAADVGLRVGATLNY
ncbi:MAG TPA: hypothetical protein VGG33_07515 [Polyangia bacterium]